MSDVCIGSPGGDAGGILEIQMIMADKGIQSPRQPVLSMPGVHTLARCVPIVIYR